MLFPMDILVKWMSNLIIPFSERNVDLPVLVDDPCNLDDDKDNDDGNRNTSHFSGQTKMVSGTHFWDGGSIIHFLCLKRCLHWNLTTSRGKCSGLLACNSFPWLAKMFMLQKGSLMSVLGVRLRNFLCKSSDLWVLSGSFVGRCLAVLVMHITDYIMLRWISLQNFSILKIESLKMSSDAKRMKEGPTDSHRDWAKLPHDVLGTIITMLGTLTDSCRFGAVCRSWYRAELEDRPNRRTVENNQEPMLMCNPDNSTVNWLKGRRAIHQENAVDIDEDRRCCGSSHGWWITMDVKSTWFTLLNPCSRIFVDVPVTMKDAMNLGNDGDNAAAVNDSEKFFIIKAVLSADPWFHANDWAMVVIFGEMCRLALYISRTQSWTFIDPQFRDFHDAIFYKGKFYLVDAYSTVYSCDINDPNIVQVVGPPAAEPQFLFRNYLFECPEGNLLQVWRWLADNEEVPGGPYETKGFQVFKLKEEEQAQPDWEEVQSLKGVALYLGDNHGISVKASAYPGEVTGNRINFTTECCDFSRTGWREPRLVSDVGRYLVRRKIIKWDDDFQKGKTQPPPIYLIPTLRGNEPDFDFNFDFADR